MKHLKQFENLNNSDIEDLKEIILELPEMRWKISEKDEDGYIYFEDEWDNWQHMEENDLAEYFAKIFSTIKKLKDKIEKL